MTRAASLGGVRGPLPSVHAERLASREIITGEFRPCGVQSQIFSPVRARCGSRRLIATRLRNVPLLRRISTFGPAAILAPDCYGCYGDGPLRQDLTGWENRVWRHLASAFGRIGSARTHTPAPHPIRIRRCTARCRADRTDGTRWGPPPPAPSPVHPLSGTLGCLPCAGEGEKSVPRDLRSPARAPQTTTPPPKVGRGRQPSRGTSEKAGGGEGSASKTRGAARLPGLRHSRAVRRSLRARHR